MRSGQLISMRSSEEKPESKTPHCGRLSASNRTVWSVCRRFYLPVASTLTGFVYNMSSGSGAMSRWSFEELNKAASLVAEIDAMHVPRVQRRRSNVIDLSLRAAIPLLEGLGGGIRAVLVRQLLRELGLDEHRHAAWRLEHK